MKALKVSFNKQVVLYIKPQVDASFYVFQF